MNAWIEIVGGDRIPVGSTLTIGRSGENILVLSGNRVSRRHALVHAQSNGEHWLVDLGSTNGTYLDGRRVRQPVPLADRNEIEIADYALVFHRAGVDPEVITQMPTTVLPRPKDRRSSPLWLLVADIVRSTVLLQTLPPEEFAGLVGRWFLACKEILEPAEGVINTFLGDGWFAYWKPSPTADAQVTETLKGLMTLQAAGLPTFRWAIHHGAAVLDTGIGDGEENVLGAEVHFAFRMEKLAAMLRLHTLVSEAAASRLDRALPLADQGRHGLSGFEGDHRFYSVGG